MPAAKKPTKKPASKRPSTAPSRNGTYGEILTLAEAAAYLRVAEKDLQAIVEQRSLPAQRVGDDWRLTKEAIHRWLNRDYPRYSKEAQLAVAGIMKDDPTFEAEMEEIVRRRKDDPVGGDDE